MAVQAQVQLCSKILETTTFKAIKSPMGGAACRVKTITEPEGLIRFTQVIKPIICLNVLDCNGLEP